MINKIVLDTQNIIQKNNSCTFTNQNSSPCWGKWSVVFYYILCVAFSSILYVVFINLEFLKEKGEERRKDPKKNSFIESRNQYQTLQKKKKKYKNKRSLIENRKSFFFERAFFEEKGFPPFFLLFPFSFFSIFHFWRGKKPTRN